MPLRAPGPVDVLSDVLGVLEPQSEVVCRSRFTAPWGLAFTGTATQFHVMERGTCVVRVSGEAPIVLGAGDLVVLPRGVHYEIADTSRRRTVPFERVVGADRQLALRLLDYGGGGAETVMLCAVSRLRNPAGMPLLASLPAALVVRAAQQSTKWLHMTTTLLLHEAETALPGSDLAMSRLLDLVFVQAVRVWLAALPAHAPNLGGWVGALRDPRIGGALALLHTTPAHAWTVTEIAQRVGMSRSPFAARFTQLLGEPPLRYLARWRLLLASRSLVSGAETIREIATNIGYDSEEAFSRAFKKQFRVAPSVYRAEQRVSMG